MVSLASHKPTPDFSALLPRIAKADFRTSVLAVLIWDLFVGRAIWLDNLTRNTPFAWSALLLTNGIGPPGLLLYVVLCIATGRGLPTLGYESGGERER